VNPTVPAPLILASGSPRRRELMATFSLPFTVVVPDTDESDAGIHPPHVPLAHAEAKAAVVATTRAAALTIGADTAIHFQGEILGKPASPAAALAMLMRLAGHEHEVITGICLLSPARHLRCRFAVTSRVRFQAFDENVAVAYLARVNVLDKAGAYALQEDDGTLVAGVSGSRSNVIGLPLEALAIALQACDFGRLTINLAPPPEAPS
jgi:nucleoside triphosphate pyrophosphatase